MFVCKATTEYTLSSYTTETDQFMCAESIETLQTNTRKLARADIVWVDLTEDHDNCVATGKTNKIETGALGESYTVYARIYKLDQERWY